MNIFLVAVLSIVVLAPSESTAAEDFKSFKQQQTQGANAMLQEFETFQKTYKKEFESYRKSYNKALAQYRKKVVRHWGEFKQAEPETWISYTPDQLVRRTVDFRTGTIVLEQLIPANSPKQAVVSRLRSHLTQLLAETEESVFRRDEVAQGVEKAMKGKPNVVTGQPRSRPALQALLPRMTSRELAPKAAADLNRIAKVSTTHSPARHQQVVRIEYVLPVNAPSESRIYHEIVAHLAKKEEVPESMIFAVIETESNFNPLARSNIPAFGLMQIVPRSAGLDATRYLFGKPRILAPSYLYNGENNIKIGSAYLHILFHNYLGEINDPVSRLYCAIAAYNTGAGNVAKAFGHGSNIAAAVREINQMSSKQVYSVLIRQLPYKETRRYLKKVAFNLSKYQA